MEEKYDSTIDTMKHKDNINKVMNVIITELLKRSKTHDDSKLKRPEKPCYDKYVPLLREEKYGTPAYLELRKNMTEEGLNHHYEVNRHHPEHWPDADISHMDIVDFVEMFVDHVASAMLSDTGYLKGEDMNSKRYKYSDQLYSIMINTYKNYYE